MDKVLEYVDVGRKEGTRFASGGLDRTILADVENSMYVAGEEIFGPVGCFIRFKTE